MAHIGRKVFAVKQNVESREKNFGLTPRELEILSAVVAGYSNREIANYCKIAEETVKHHLSNMFDKLGVSRRLDLALFAVNQRIPLKSIEGLAPPARTFPAQTPVDSKRARVLGSVIFFAMSAAAAYGFLLFLRSLLR